MPDTNEISIELNSEFLDESHSDSSYLYLSVICGALKYCLGQASSMSFIKLAYIFDKTTSLEPNAFESKATLATWDISKVFKSTLIIAYKNEYIDFHPKESKLRISLSPKGDDYILSLESLGVFKEYREYLNKIKLPENRFDDIKLRCVVNEY